MKAVEKPAIGRNRRRVRNELAIRLLEKSDRNFIPGLRPEHENIDSAEANSLQLARHDTLIPSVEKAFGAPLTVAANAVASAFERNFMIAKLLETKGKVIEAAVRANVDKKTFIEKMKLHDIKKRMVCRLIFALEKILFRQMVSAVDHS